MSTSSRLVAAALIAVGCVTVQGADELVILSPHWEGVRYEFGDAFARRYKAETGREVVFKWLDVGGASDILRYIRSEFKRKPGGIGVDVFFGGGTEPYTELKKLGFLAPCRLPDAILRQLPPDMSGVPLYDPEHTWYAAAMAGFGIIYNKEVLRRLGLPEPKTWEDLARPEVRTWVGSADPRKSGSMHVMYEIILQAYGWERGWQIITAMGANVRGFSANASQTTKDVALGEVAYGLAIDSYAWAQVREAGEELIGYVMPQDLTVVNGDAIAILKGAPNRKLAERFLAFVMSEEGQKLWLLRQGEPDGPQRFELGKFSVLPAVYPKVRGRTTVGLNPFEWKSSLVYDAVKGSTRWDVVNELLGTQIIDPHRQLAAAWARAIEQGNSEGRLKELSAPPVDEAAAQQLAETGKWRDAEIKTRTVNAWAASARDKYGGGGFGLGVLRNVPAVLALAIGIVMVIYLRRRTA